MTRARSGYSPEGEGGNDKMRHFNVVAATDDHAYGQAARHPA
ncbi:hypothetical protein [Archangium lansingense]|uniref:Uncharacterized protein n=1 Tax=Archangium lansingense TaxID=2995310 RepID=A0ABT4AP91_9BACT|nr:hypothetical protein [Archangium lansinium]MCY1083411.1 hypothetical protein [Archangium lansinium]